MDRISVLEYANSLIYATLINEQKILAELLRENLKEEIGVKEVCGRNYHGNVYSDKKRSINDYRNYRWICVTCNEKKYWLTLFYSDIDTNAGNFHTQFGRIQFWKNVFKKLEGAEY